MANSVTHAALPFPVKGARFSLAIPYLDADGDPTDPTTPDTERSIDAAAFADCTEEVTTISGSNGVGYITLTGDEMNGSMIAVAAKVASGPKATLATLYPRVLPVLESGTAQAGAAGSITLASGAAAYSLIGCIVKTSGGTGGGGGSGSLGNQARVITAYNTSTKVATVVPNWETTPDATTTYEILLTDMAGNALLANALAWNGAAVATPHTAGYPVVTIKDGTGTGEIDTSGGAIVTVTNLTNDPSGVTTLLSRLSATRAGYLDNLSAGAVATAAKLLSYFQSALRSDVTVDADIGGSYDDATDSLQAIRDRGDAAWTTATGFSTLDEAGVRTAVGLASANLDTQLDALPTATENADALLKRDWTAVSGEAARSVLNALRFLRNKWSVSGGTLTVTEEDDTTTAWTAAVTDDSGADPIIGVDPA